MFCCILFPDELVFMSTLKSGVSRNWSVPMISNRFGHDSSDDIVFDYCT